MKRILLVEPDKILAQVYKASLKRAGYEVTQVSGAQEAIISANDFHPDIVVLELKLVGHNGVEFLYEFRSYPDWQEIPVIINSLIHPREFASSAILWREIKVAGYLYKPQSSLKQLSSAIRFILDKEAQSSVPASLKRIENFYTARDFGF
jgi:DNA-binding response OmpR family regulator